MLSSDTSIQQLSRKMTDVMQNEEAAKALDIGKKAVEAGQFEKAVKMLEKSIRMRKTAEAETLLDCARKGVARAEAKKNPEPVTPLNTVPDRPFTKEQENACRVIIASKTHYETLSIERTASADEIKKAYRKLALKFHPDKCPAPNADEAFKKISKAFKVLLDPDDRAFYDRHGESENMPSQRGHSHQQGGFHEMDADELLRWFMSGGLGAMPGGMNGGRHPNVGRVHHFGRGGQGFYQGGVGGGGGNREQDGIYSIQQFFSMFILFMLLVSSWSTVFDGGNGKSVFKPAGQAFSLFPDKQYTVKRKTAMHGVVSEIPYYVESKFASTVGRSPIDLYYVEREVEASLYKSLREKCQNEMAYKNEQIGKARAVNDQGMMEIATKMELPSCALQNDLEKKKKRIS